MNTPLIDLNSEAAQALLQKEYKLAFFDIDGTLLGLEGQYTQRLKQALLALRQAGVKTAVASGRPQFAAQFLIDDLQLSDMGVFYTGALIQEPQGQTLAAHVLDQPQATQLLQAGLAADLHTEVYGLKNYYVQQQTPLGELHAEHLRCQPQTTDLLSVVDQAPVIKLLFAAKNPQEQAQLKELEAQFAPLIFAYAKMAAKPDWLFASVISPKACKQQAFDQLLAYHNVSAEQVMAFGDAQSDKVFLSRAGLGVAMGNAAADVKEVASLVTAPVWDDGVAQVIEAYLS